MNSIKYRNQGDKISLGEIETFEEVNKVKLPQDYKHFLLRNNGGIPDKIYYVENNADLVVNFFLSLGSEKYSLEEYFEDFKINKKILPIELIPIGEDAFGNVICISYTLKSINNIFVWNHETETVTFVASSLIDILNNLRSKI